MPYIYLFYQTWHTNKSYSDNNEHRGSAALTDAPCEIKLVKKYNETLTTILHYVQ